MFFDPTSGLSWPRSWTPPRSATRPSRSRSTASARRCRRSRRRRDRSDGTSPTQRQNWRRYCLFLSRLQRIVTCSGPNQKNQPNLYLYLVRGYKICHFPMVLLYLCIGQNLKNQPNLDLYLVRRYKICHFPIVVSYLCIGQNLKNQPNLVLYLVRRSKIFASVATLPVTMSRSAES